MSKMCWLGTIDSHSEGERQKRWQRERCRERPSGCLLSAVQTVHHYCSCVCVFWGVCTSGRCSHIVWDPSYSMFLTLFTTLSRGLLLAWLWGDFTWASKREKRSAGTDLCLLVNSAESMCHAPSIVLLANDASDALWRSTKKPVRLHSA